MSPIENVFVAAGDESALFASLVEASPNVVGIADVDGRVRYLNAVGRAVLGIAEPAELTFNDLFVLDDVAIVREVMLPELRREGRWTGNVRLQRRGAGLPLAVEMSVYELPEGAAGSARATAFVAADVTERARSDQRTRALLDVGSTLTDMSDARKSFAALAELLVRTLATICFIDLFEEREGHRQVVRVAAFHIDRAWRGRSAQLLVPGNDGKETLSAVIRLMGDGQSTLVPQIDAAWIERNVRSSEYAATIRAMRLRSLITVPLVAAGEIVGSLTCALGEEAVPRGLPDAYDSEDLFFVEELGRRAGRSIETARLHERERRIAETLQAASLPQTLPSTSVFRIDADYRPGSAEATIGGDWFDAFVLMDGRVVLTVGDVLGNGLHAAVTMTKLRQAMQSAAMVDADPNVMLNVADRTLRLHAAEGYATAIAAIYDPSTSTTTIASAGHPGPVLRTAGGRVIEYESPGLLLGLRDGDDTGSVLIATPPGTLLVFFTDGLTEATRDADEGMRRIRAALEDDAVALGERPARAIVETVLRGESAGDDIAVLTLRIC